MPIDKCKSSKIDADAIIEHSKGRRSTCLTVNV